MNMTCQICKFISFKSYKALFEHSQQMHMLTPRQYCALQLENGVESTCACGCGEQVTFFLNTRTFGKFKQGHASRIKNNWGHNKKALEKSHQTMKEKRLDGTYTAWNKGLSKETDERVAAYGKSQSKNFTEARKKLRSIRMSNNRRTGIIPTLYGSDSSRWKGGTSALNASVNADDSFYRQWKFPKLHAANFTCTACGSKNNLCIHHNEERMSTIIRRFKNALHYNAAVSNHELKRKVIESVIKYHLDNNVSGIVLCYTCHKKEHKSLNFN